MPTLKALLLNELATNLKAPLSAKTIAVIKANAGSEQAAACFIPILQSIKELYLLCGKGGYPFIQHEIEDYLDVELQQAFINVAITDPSVWSRFNSLMGMKVGDALGAPFEFKPDKQDAAIPDKLEMIAGGYFRSRPAANWTDDSAQGIANHMAHFLSKCKHGPNATFPAALAKSLTMVWNKAGFACGSLDHSIGLGGTVATALDAWHSYIILLRQNPDAPKVTPEQHEAMAFYLTCNFDYRLGTTADGNGALMRLAGVVALCDSVEQALDYAYLSAKVTTGGNVTADLTRWFAYLIFRGFEINRALDAHDESSQMTEQERFKMVHNQLLNEGYEEEKSKFYALIEKSQIAATDRPTDLIQWLMKQGKRFTGDPGYFSGIDKRISAYKENNTGIIPHPADGSDFYDLKDSSQQREQYKHWRAEQTVPNLYTEDDRRAEAVWQPNKLTDIARMIIESNNAARLPGEPQNPCCDWRGKKYHPHRKSQGGYYGSWSPVLAALVLHRVHNGETPTAILKKIAVSCGDSDTIAAVAGGLLGAWCGRSRPSAEMKKWTQQVLQHPINKGGIKAEAVYMAFMGIEVSVQKSTLKPELETTASQYKAPKDSDKPKLIKKLIEALVEHDAFDSTAEATALNLDILFTPKEYKLLFQTKKGFAASFLGANATNSAAYPTVAVLLHIAGQQGIKVKGLHVAHDLAKQQGYQGKTVLNAYQQGQQEQSDQDTFQQMLKGVAFKADAIVYRAKQGELAIKFFSIETKDRIITKIKALVPPKSHFPKGTTGEKALIFYFTSEAEQTLGYDKIPFVKLLVPNETYAILFANDSIAFDQQQKLEPTPSHESTEGDTSSSSAFHASHGSRSL